jgi:hypothetical protein
MDETQLGVLGQGSSVRIPAASGTSNWEVLPVVQASRKVQENRMTDFRSIFIGMIVFLGHSVVKPMDSGGSTLDVWTHRGSHGMRTGIKISFLLRNHGMKGGL